MRSIRTLALLTSTTLLLFACNNDAQDALIAVKENTNPLLAYAPADTPYVFAGLETVPENVTDAYMTRIQPVLDEFSDKARKFKREYAAGEHQDDQMATLASAILDELGGDISAESLKNLGISVQSHHAMYGVGVFPVIRLELSDAPALRDAINRIEAKAGFEVPVKNFNGTDYWSISEDDSPVGLYVAILDQQLAISLFPTNAQDRLLASFLGHEMPAHSMADSNALAILNNEKGYTGYGSGILDLEKLTDELLNPGSTTHSYLGPEERTQLPSVDAVCVAEIKALVANMPRMTVGTTNLTTNEFAVRYELEMDSLLASALAGLVSDIPPATDGDQLLNASLAFRVGKLRTFLLEKATAVTEMPYQCEKMQELNETAQKMVQKLNIPMPPMVNNLLGVRVSVDDIDPGASVPMESGLMALHVEKPEMFVGMASMMIPGFEELDLANQKEPVRIPSELFHVQNLDIFALMNDSAIGVAVGENNAPGLKQFMSAKNQDNDNATFLSVSYNSARAAELQSSLMGEHKFDPDTGDKEFDAALQASYLSFLGISRLDMRFTDEGLVMDSRMNFK